MKRLWIFFAAFIITFLFTIAHGQSFLITNVNIISMADEKLQEKKSILIRDGKITRIADKIQQTKDALLIDAKGAYLIPGLFDMHMHFYHDQGLDKKFLTEEIKLPLANGVTTVRIMNGRDEYLKLRESVATGKVPGPEMFVASPQLIGKWPFRGPVDGKIVQAKNDAIEAVKLFKSQGYDAIKITEFITPDVYDGIIETARSVGIKVTGHVGPDIKLPRALAAKQQIEHFDEFIEMLLPDTSINHGKSVSDFGIWSKKLAWPTLEYVNEAGIDGLSKKVKQAGIYVTATNYFFTKCFAIGVTPGEVERFPNYPYVPAFMKKNAEDFYNHFWVETEPPPAALREKYLRVRYKMALSLYNAGVKLMTGSDSPEWYLTPGFTVHDEIESYTKAGLGNFAALQTATINPAEYLGISNRKGTIQEGKDAELILLDKNPLEDIQNTRTIRAVFSKKKYYDRNALDKLLDEAKVISTAEATE